MKNKYHLFNELILVSKREDIITFEHHKDVWTFAEQKFHRVEQPKVT